MTLVVRACLVASHFVHDDQNPGDTGVNQRGNTGKAWNANHVEGGIGMGLAAASGADGKGYVVSGAAGLPNVGQTGMAEEFESTDGGGKRSDLMYVSLGWNNSLANLWLVDHFGDVPQNAAGAEVLRRYTVGTTDFFNKAARGYRSWSLATDKGVYDTADLESQTGYGSLAAVAPTLLPSISSASNSSDRAM